jgi:HK97 family phage portal protein
MAWPIGAGVVELGDAAWGHAQDDYAPADYGEYIATSNAVYACATLRARLLSSLPLLPYRLRPRKGKEAVAGGPVFDLLHKVNPHWTWNRMAQQIELSLCLWGQAYIFVERGRSGRLPPRELWWGRPDRVRPVVDPSRYITGYQYYPLNSSAPITFTAGEVVWLRYPNPIDEFSGLSPLAAARLAADYASAAMKANKNLFEHGLHMGGMISLADKAQVMTRDQADEIGNLIDKRYRGADNAHRWMVLRAALNVQGLSITPKDADYLGGLKESLEQICRAYNVPLDLIGGQRTYDNVNASMRAMWNHCIKPEAMFIASELTEQLLPMFASTGGVDLLEFDFEDVEELKEEENEHWARWQQQIAAGARTINEWRADEGLDPLPWGDVWWAPFGAKAIEDAEPEPEPEPLQLAPIEDEQEPEAEPEPEPEAEEDEDDEAPGRMQRRGIAYGSERHRALWQRFVDRTEAEERRFGAAVADLFRRQRDSILAVMGQRAKRADPWDEIAAEPFDMSRWVREFRLTARPLLRDITAESGQQAVTDLGLGLAFDVTNPQVTRFIEQRTQRFAQQVCETTWEWLREELAAGIEAGEDIDVLARRVERVMSDRITSSGEVIARTEVIGANNGGALAGWRQAQADVGPLLKHWLAALDDRTRDSHIAAHERYNGAEDGIPLEENFEVGGGAGPAPGQIGIAEEDIQCFVPGTAVQGIFDLALETNYAGPVWQLETRRGYRLTVTPNHPILTDQGWLPAHQLREGMYALSYRQDFWRAVLNNEYHQHRPVAVEDVFKALSANGRTSSAMLVALHLHGDAIWTDGQVELVHADRELPIYLKAVAGHENAGYIQLPAATGAGGTSIHAVGALDLFGGGNLPAPASAPGRCALALDHDTISPAPLDLFGGRLAPQWYAALAKQRDDGCTAASRFLSQLVAASAGEIAPDEIIAVRELEFRGHVYDLQSPHGWMIAQGIVSSNCRCTMFAVPAPF